MALIDEKDAAIVRERLAKLAHPVKHPLVGAHPEDAAVDIVAAAAQARAG